MTIWYIEYVNLITLFLNIYSNGLVKTLNTAFHRNRDILGKNNII